MPTLTLTLGLGLPHQRKPLGGPTPATGDRWLLEYGSHFHWLMEDGVSLWLLES
jgi:hypothetical protein